MLSVILIWFYIGITTFIIGYGVLRVITRHLPYYADAYFMCGLVCVTVYAQFFSLFVGVGLGANLILCGLCALTILVDGKALTQTVRRLFAVGQQEESGAEAGVWRFGQLRLCAVTALFLLFAYGASRGMIHYDTGLYHAQSIRWIEEYGVVKGLGNLHCRLAYNSASFALSALYSMAFLGGQSYHCAAGWLAFLLAAVCLRMGKSLRAGRLRTSDFARVMCVYYLVNIFDEMVSPASDYFMVLIAFYIVIKWLELSESGERTILPYALLCVLGVFLMTVKLSGALILLLTVYPACCLLREKRWGETGVYLVLGFVTALPFFIRNVVISGWLVYPFTQIDWFNVAWKIPKGLADYDAAEIQVWGRGYTDVTQLAVPMREWLPGWFRTLAGSDRLLVLAAGAAVFMLLVQMAYLAVRRCKCGGWQMARQTSSHVRGTTAPDGSAAQGRVPADFPTARGGLAPAGGLAVQETVPAALLAAQGTVAASFLFWLCTSPLIRYGCVWVYLTVAVVFGGIYETVTDAAGSGRRTDSGEQYVRGLDGDTGGKMHSGAGGRHGKGGRWQFAADRVVLAVVALLLAYKGLALCRGIAGSYVNDYWFAQKDYENFETRSYEIEGFPFYCPVEGDRVGYDSFPSSPQKAEILLLGEGISDGFRAAER